MKCRVTRKVLHNRTDRNALKEALQYFLNAAIDDLLSRADYDRIAAEINVIVMERGPDDCSDSAGA